MRNLKVKDILEVTGGDLIIGNENLECENFCRDTRVIQKGDIFIGIKGGNFDGNLLWKEALNNGASCVIIQDIDFDNKDLGVFEGKTIIKVKDTMNALYEIATYKRNLYNIPVVAITGSVGKTSTKDIISSVVAQKYKTLKTIGNNNNNIGLPFTILRLKDEEAMVLEMGMNHLGEISLLTKIAKPDICVITNIGTSHIGNLGTRENILKAKLEILEGSTNPKVIINNDNDLLHKWYEENREDYDIKTYGIENESDVNVSDIVLNSESSDFGCNIQNNKVAIHVPVGGEHFVLNSMCAVLVGEALDIDMQDIKRGIETFELTKKRMDITELNSGVKIINDAYNASLESMQASLKYLAKYKNNRKIAVLGDMFELGDFSKELHQKVGKEIIKNKIDILICSGENSISIVEEAKKGGMSENNIYYFQDKIDINNLLKRIAKKGDVILFKASNGMKFFELAEHAKNIL